MDTDPIVAPPRPFAHDARTLLAHLNPKIAWLRRAIGHDHRDEATWTALGWTPAGAQSARAYLRIVADLLHVERAHQRGRLHGTRFATLADQQAWLEGMEGRTCACCTRAAGLPSGATLRALRTGELPMLRDA